MPLAIAPVAGTADESGGEGEAEQQLLPRQTLAEQLEQVGGWGPFQYRLLLFCAASLGVDGGATVLSVFAGRPPAYPWDGRSYVADLGLTGAVPAALQSLFFLGWMVGAVAAGRLADAPGVGRRYTSLLSICMGAAGTCVIALAPTVHVLVLGMLLLGAGVGGKALALYSLGCECVGDSKRALYVALLWTIW